MTIKKTILGFMATALLIGATGCQANIEIINDSPYTIEVIGYYYEKNQQDYEVLKPDETAIFNDHLVVFCQLNDQKTIAEEENNCLNPRCIWVPDGIKIIRIKAMHRQFIFEYDKTDYLNV